MDQAFGMDLLYPEPLPEPSDQKKKVTLSYLDRLKIIEDIYLGKSRKLIQAEYSVSASTISNIIRSKDKVYSMANAHRNLSAKRVRLSPYEKLNQQLSTYVINAKKRKFPINGDILRTNALALAKELGIEGFNASNGWMGNFKKKYNVSFKDPNEEDIVTDEDQLTQWTVTLPTLLGSYRTEDIYVMGETCLFFRYLPETPDPYAPQKEEGQEDDKNETQIKGKITLVLGCNMLGTDRLDMWVVGKPKLPNALRASFSLPWEYRNNNDALMDKSIFKDWIQTLDFQLTQSKRKIILFLDDTPAHPRTFTESLDSIKVIYFPPDHSAELNPMTNGIFEHVKYHYRSELLTDYITSYRKKETYSPPDIKQALRKLNKSWEIKLKGQLIRQCFQQCGFDSSITIQPVHLPLRGDYDFSPLTRDDELLDYSLPASPDIWAQFVRLTKVNTPFSHYLNIDRNNAVTHDITLRDLMAPIEPIIYQPPTPTSTTSQPRKPPTNPITRNGHTQKDKAIRAIFNFLQEQRFVPPQAYRALNYIEEKLQ